MSVPFRHLPLKEVVIVLVIVASIAWAGEKNVNVAMLLCVFPGGGQFYTERYVPGVIIGAAEITLGYFAYKYHHEGDTAGRNSMLWWGLFVFGYSLADAYVGAKMYGFDVQTDLDKVSISYNINW